MTASPLSVFRSHALPSIAVLALVAMAIPARAQTTIRMTTTQGQPCVAVTNANGLTLVPGSTDLQATGVTLSGTGCGGGGSPPTSPNGLALTATPAAPTAGVTFSVSWQVANATTCVGSITAGTAGNVAGWTSVSTPSSPRTVTISSAGAYTLVLTCSNTASPTNLVSPPLQLTVGAGTGGSCNGPTGLSRLTTSDIQYGAYVYPGAPTRLGVDVTEWNNIWGHRNATDNLVTWPGVAGSGPSISQFGRANYVAAHFRTTADLSLYGNFAYPESTPGPNIDLKISTACGDFSADTLNPGCVVTNAASAGQVVMNWTFVPGNRSKCALLPNTDYYFNIKMNDPNSTVDCSAGNPLCPVELALTFGN